MAKSTEMHGFWKFMVAMNEMRIPNYLFMNIIIFNLTRYMNKNMTCAQLTFGNSTNDFDSQISLRSYWIHGHCQTWTWSRNRWRRWQESQPSMRRRKKVMNPDLTWRFARNIHSNFNHLTTSIRRNTHFETHIRSDKKSSGQSKCLQITLTTFIHIQTIIRNMHNDFTCK